MTIQATPLTRPVIDRRHPCGDRPRLSWAQGRPFIVQPAREVARRLPGQAVAGRDPREAARERRAGWTRPLVLRSAIGDAVVGLVVPVAVTAALGGTLPRVVVIAAASGVAWMLALLCLGAYRSRLLGDGPEEFQAIARASVLVFATVASAAFVLPVQPPRREVLIALPVVALLTAVHRHLQRKDLHGRRAAGRAGLRTLVVGDSLAVEQTVSDLSGNEHHGFEVVGRCVTTAPSPSSVPSFGVLAEVPQVVVDQSIDAVIVAGQGVSGAALRRLSWALEHTGADLIVSPGLVELTGPNVSLRPTAGLSLLHVEPPSRHLGRMIAKNLIDRVVGLVALVLATPVLIVAALAVKLTSSGPVIYRQARVGQDGDSFVIYKLRTMVRDADGRRCEVLSGSDRDGLMFKMHADPRVTPVGRWLRRFSIDELPQLWNVLRGDMALVGPRPPLPEEYEAYVDQVHRRMRVKPGLTGLWQVSGRSDLSWEESVRLDLRYVDNWSICLDVLILWKTAHAVLRGGGAY